LSTDPETRCISNREGQPWSEPIDEDENDTCRRDGVVNLPGFVDDTTASTMLAAIDRHCGSPSEWHSNNIFVTDRCFGVDVPALKSYLLNEHQVVAIPTPRM